eukprot:CAMPEP_0204008668 /NCGR_PEP_ID=MMETSP0360-20130528/21314_1 /ASSEMBLY_ACC=CAM_ASM_000342 /TAXON_ID=268821 /ORGANISM="Scrippsiella Hangoei, Strain SHTV-5" /LENGTH=157 /DNA_ID=CAMNT_0050950985 /DNA_START=22 /DNA_END=497 /DNA_ORIENTATION=-
MSPSGVAANHAVPPIFTNSTRSCHNSGWASSGYRIKALCNEVIRASRGLGHAPAPPLGRPQNAVVLLKGLTHRAAKPLRSTAEEEANAEDKEDTQEQQLEGESALGELGHTQVQFAAGQVGHVAQVEHDSDGQLGAAGHLGTNKLVTTPWDNALAPS